MRSIWLPLTRRVVRATSLLAGLLVGIFAAPVGADETGIEIAGNTVERASEKSSSRSNRNAASNRTASNRAASNRAVSNRAGGRAVLDRGARAARPDFAAPALYSASLPLGRLAALPDLPAVIVPRSNMGLDWQEWSAPLGAFQPREIIDGGGVSSARRSHAHPSVPASIGSTVTIGSAVTSGSNALGAEFEQAIRPLAPNWGMVSTEDRLDLRRPRSGSSRERTVLREWERPAPQPTPSSMLIGLDDAHSQLLRSLRPERAPAGEAHRDVFQVRPEPVDPRKKAIRALGEKMLYRELRRYFRRELKDQFEEDPSFGIDSYLDRRGLIGQLGRGGRAEDLVIEERVTELRNEYLDASEENFERDIPILQWGPLVLDDRGGVNIDVVDLKERDHEEYSFELAPEARRVGGYGESILFPDERYRVSSNLKLNPDLREVGRDWNEAIGKMTASVEIDWRAPVLEDRAFSAELGGSIRADGRYGLYLNFVIYGK